MKYDQSQINMMFRSPENSLNYIKFLGANLDYDSETNSVINRINGFRVANLARLDIAQDIINAFHKSQAEGKSERWFVDYLKPTLRAKGWWHTIEEIDDETGEIKEARVGGRGIGSPARLKLIFENLCNSMYATSRYITMRSVAGSYPYWQYHAVDDSHTRDEHAKLRNKVFRWDDPIWSIIYPPNGHRCRCSVYRLSEEDIKTRGLTVLKGTEIIHTDGRRGVSFTDESGEVVEFFPDAGFDNNPAEQYYPVDLARYNLELAQHYTQAELDGQQLEKMYTDAVNGEVTNDSITAAVLPPDDAANFGLDSSTIKLQQFILNAQKQNKILLPLDELRQLQTLILHSEVVFNYNNVICFCHFDGVYWMIVGVTRNGEIHVLGRLTPEAFTTIAKDSHLIRGTL